MSFTNPRKLAGWRRNIVFGLVAAAILALPLGFMAWAFGSCPAFGSSDCEPPSRFTQLFVFPGVSVALFVAALTLRKIFSQEERV